MFFNKKDKKQKKCESCSSKTEERYSFCPYCGNSFIDLEKEKNDFGFLGREDTMPEEQDYLEASFGITDKLIGSIMNSMMKNLDRQFKGQFKDANFENAEIRTLPNGVRIKIAGPMGLHQEPPRRKRAVKQEITQSQLKKMSSLPKTKAKTNVKRLGGKVVYELTTPGVESPQDVFVSKLESGYEVKAIGNKKIYVNSIPISLPLTKYSVIDNKLFFEFNAQG